MTVMLLCAGEGRRLRPHTSKVPKPAIPFLTVPMAAYGLAWAQEVGPTRTVVNTFHLPEKIHELFHRMNPVHPHFSDEKTLLGSGGGIKNAEALITGDDFLVVNGDGVFLPARAGLLTEALKQHRRSGALATLLVMKYPGVGATFGGVWRDSGGKVIGFGKTKPAGASEGWHYIGAVFLSRRIFSRLSPGQASDILLQGLAPAIAAGEPVGIFPVEGWWHETGNEKDYLTATAEALPFLFTENNEGQFLRDVVRKHCPLAAWTRQGSSIILQATPASRNCELSGFVVLGTEASLPDGSSHENAVLGDGVQALADVKNALIL